MKKIGLSMLLMLAVMSAQADVYQDPVTKVNYEYTPGGNQASVVKSADATGDITILSKFSVDGNEYTVTSIGSFAFYGCTSLTSIQFPANLTSIGLGAFYSCGLTSVTIPKECKFGDERISNPFMACTNLESIKIEEGNPYYDSRNDCNAIIITATNRLMGGCKNTVIPSGVKAIDRYAFYANGVEAMTIPEVVESIGENAFSHNNLVSIEIPNTVTLIDESVFDNNEKLTKLTIPASVKEIRAGAFLDAPLKTVICNIEEPFALTEKTFGIATIDPSTGSSSYKTPSATLIVPKGAKAKYTAAEGWKQFKNIVEEGYYFYAHRASDFRLTEILTRLWRENPDGQNGVSTAVEADKSFIEELGNYQKLTAIPTENTTLDVGEYVSSAEKKEFDCGTFRAEFDLNDVWVIVPEVWHNECLPVDMRNDAGFQFGFDKVFSLSIDETNYTVFINTGSLSTSNMAYSPYDHFIAEDGSCFRGDKEASTTAFAGRIVPWTVTDFAIPEQVENGGRTYTVDKIEIERLVKWPALQSITIPATIKSDFALSGCNSLQKVTSLIEDPTDTSGSFKAERTVTTADGGTTTEYYTPSAVLYVPKGTVEKYKQAEGWKAFKYILEIGSPQPGDANCDGTVDVSDVTATVNSILDKEEGHFVESAADMNGDGIINVADIIIMVSHILKTEE